MEEVQQIKVETAQIAAKKSAAYIAVENLFLEFKNKAALTTYNDFVDYQYDKLIANSNYVIPTSERNTLISNLGIDFSTKLAAVENLNLTKSQI